MENDNTLNERGNLDIAIIGMSCRFPGANNADKFWQNLRAGVESITFFSDEELKESGIDPVILSDPSYVKAAPLLDGPELFDAPFFRYSPKEAETMDPQHRLFLECAWEALEDAGYDADRYESPIGVYAGASMNTYLLSSGLLHNFVADNLATLIGNDKDFLTTRVSYKLNLKGPSVTVGTACSTSLVAIHMACQSLLNEECDMALAGGVSVRVPHRAGYFYERGSIVSPDGHCRAFDAKAQGTIFGSGLGIVVLKRLGDAISDGDCIHAIIKGSAINNDGHSKVDYTAPSVDGQSMAIAQALANAGVEADTISYIETHGTATALGDPIEIVALTRAFRNYTDKKGFCAIGSVKTNIGHLDAAAGVASLIKTILMLKHKMIPPSLHFEKANPEIDFQNTPFYVCSKLDEWKSDSHPRRAGVSSFGVGGTNAHIIVEEAPDVEASGKSRPWQLLLLSARTGTALETATTNLINHLKHHPDLNLADVACTLQNGRKTLNHRRMLVCQGRDDAVTTLETLDPERVSTSFQEPTNGDIAFIFSGQGSQYVNMGLELYQNEPRFREQIDLCSEILKPHLSLDLRDILYPAEGNTDQAARVLDQTYITQPALFTIEYALAKLWMAWGVHPVAMVGHSIGEYVAACLAGVFSLEDALSLVAARGRLMQELPPGSMLAVFLSEKEIEPLLGENLSLAVINGPSLCVVSGEKEAVEDLEKRLSNKNVDCRHVHTSHAFHSKMMEPILDTFTERINKISRNAPQIPFVSNVTGTWITSEEAMDASYWARHLRQTVRFSDCMQELLKEPNRVFLEVGPGRTFSTLTEQHPSRTKDQIVLSSTRHPKEKKSDEAFILGTLGQLWLAGIPVDWPGFYANERRHHLPLPTYPFEGQRYWSGAEEQGHITAAVKPSPLKELTEVASSKLMHPEQETGDARVDSGSNVEQILADIWRRTLGVKQVDFGENFFDLGGTSLIAVRLFADIEKILGRKLPISTLYKAPTLGQLASILRGYEGTASWTSLVEMQHGNSELPIFFIHGAGGDVLVFRDLIHRLGPDLHAYGLQARGLDGEQPFYTRIEDMATQYVQEIQTVQPNGPYLLAGFCMGGTVALEMALQLQAQGQKVALLVLLETYNWGNISDTTWLDRVFYNLEKFGFDCRRLLSEWQYPGLFRTRIALTYERMKPRLGEKLHLGKERHSYHYLLEKSNDRSVVYYMPKTAYQGRIVQFVPAKECACYNRPDARWDTVAVGGVELYKLPLYRRQMFTEPFVSLLAEKLKVCIRKTLDQEAKVRK